jgi:hypothetical protein
MWKPIMNQIAVEYQRFYVAESNKIVQALTVPTTDDPDPYLRGIADHAAGVPRHKNPYEDDPETYGSTYWESWFEGWDAAEDGLLGPQ